MRVDKFNPFLLLAPKPQIVAAAPSSSWWTEHNHSSTDWYARARSEAPRMNASPEARTIIPRCLDDLK